MFSSQLNQVFSHVSGTILMSPFRTACERRRGELGGVDIPLVGEPRLDHDARAVAVGRRDHAVLDTHQSAFGFEQLDDRLARIVACRGRGIPAGSAVLRLDDTRLRIEHVEHVGGLDAGALAHLEVIEVVARRDLDRAAAELGIGMLVGDDRDQRPVIGCRICLADRPPCTARRRGEPRPPCRRASSRAAWSRPRSRREPSASG